MAEGRDERSVESLQTDAAHAQTLATKALENARLEVLAAEDDGKLAESFESRATTLTALAAGTHDTDVLVVRLSDALVMQRHATSQRTRQVEHLLKHAEWMETACRQQNRRSALLNGALLIASPWRKPP